jgi:hypothetical protein
VLQWCDLVIPDLRFTDDLTPLLLRLPSLERLESDLRNCRRFEFLTALPRLTALEIQLSWMKDDAWRNLLGVFSSHGLARLCRLVRRRGPCTADDLANLLSHTPALTSLVLEDLQAVSSLPFFRQLPTLAATLTHLTVACWQRWPLTAADLPPLLVLQQLRELRLLNWPGLEPDRLTAADRAPFEQRPCAVLPQLAVFEWRALQ